MTVNKKVSDEELIAFLTLWLLKCIFYCKSLKIAKRYITLANQLHEGKYVCLTQLILGSLYEPLGIATEVLRNLHPKDSLLLSGPFWLLQLCLNSTFELPFSIDKPSNADTTIKDRHIKGV